MRLFQTSRRFKVEIQPQLTMLQKTLLNVEGLGRQLDPDLDLWKTVKPIMQSWMDHQVGFKGFMDKLKAEAPRWAQLLPTLPRLLATWLEGEIENRESTNKVDELTLMLAKQLESNRRWKYLAISLSGAVLGGLVVVASIFLFF